jgi:CRISPR-associated endoribonuclease Cas6
MSQNDLTSIVVNLRAMQPIEIHEHMGRASQEFALRMVERRDPALAIALHPKQGNHDLKPFTTSGLLREQTTEPVTGVIHPNQRVSVRLTALTRPMSDCLDHLVNNPPTKKECESWYTQGLIQVDGAMWRDIPDNMPICEYDHRLWRLDSICTEPAQHLWAGHLNYAELVEQVERAQRTHQLRLRFVSPTTFHSKGLDVPLPIPTLIFRSLSERWNAFAPIPVSANFLLFVEQFVAVTKYDTQTAMLQGKQGGKHTGFVGEVLFTIKASNPGLREHDPVLADVLMQEHERFSNLVSMFGRYSFFSGVGRQTTTGMGMCAMPTRVEE